MDLAKEFFDDILSMELILQRNKEKTKFLIYLLDINKEKIKEISITDYNKICKFIKANIKLKIRFFEKGSYTRNNNIFSTIYRLKN